MARPWSPSSAERTSDVSGQTNSMKWTHDIAIPTVMSYVMDWVQISQDIRNPIYCNLCYSNINYTHPHPRIRYEIILCGFRTIYSI